MSDEDTTLADVLRSGESVVWTGHPDLRPGVPTLQTVWPLAFQIVVAAGYFWVTRAIQTPEVTGFFAVMFCGLIIWQAIGAPLVTRRRLSRTTYYLTDRRAIVADGRTVKTMGLGASPLLKYAAGGDRVTATFGPTGPQARFEFLKPPPKDAVDFTNVTDVEGLVSALDHLARGAEPRQLRSDWEAYEADGSAANSPQHLPEQPHT